MENKKNLIEILKPLFEGEIEFDVFLHENLTYISSIQTLETIEEYEALLTFCRGYCEVLIQSGYYNEADVWVTKAQKILDIHRFEFESEVYENAYEYFIYLKTTILISKNRYGKALKYVKILKERNQGNDIIKGYYATCVGGIASIVAWTIYGILGLIWVVTWLQSRLFDSVIIPEGIFEASFVLWLVTLIGHLICSGLLKHYTSK